MVMDIPKGLQMIVWQMTEPKPLSLIPILVSPTVQCSLVRTFHWETGNWFETEYNYHGKMHLSVSVIKRSKSHSKYFKQVSAQNREVRIFKQEY